MIKELTKLANHLDAKGFKKEADYLDVVISKYAIALEIGGFEHLDEGSVLKTQEGSSDAYIDTFPEEYSDLDRTNITKDEAFSAGCSVCGSQAKDDCGHKSSSYMAKPQLHKIYEYSKKLYDMIDENEQLPDWMESSIAKVDHMIGAAYHSYAHKKEKGVDEQSYIDQSDQLDNIVEKLLP